MSTRNKYTTYTVQENGHAQAPANEIIRYVVDLKTGERFEQYAYTTQTGLIGCIAQMPIGTTVADFAQEFYAFDEDYTEHTERAEAEADDEFFKPTFCAVQAHDNDTPIFVKLVHDYADGIRCFVGRTPSGKWYNMRYLRRDKYTVIETIKPA